MKKTRTGRKISFIVVALLLFLNIFYIEEVFAQNIVESMEINVFINEDGSARIRETRSADLTEGTENYIVIGNLGESTIRDFVVEEDGKVYQYIDDWDINDSREEKAFKNGIIDTGGGYELAWGIGEYGRHEYVLEYTVTDIIKEIQDGQVLFWRFVNDGLNTPPQEATITIESEKPFAQGQEEIYAFGYTGDIQFVDGKIIAKTSEPLDSSNYMTILVGLQEGFFLSSDYIDTSLEELKEIAFVGSDYGPVEDDDFYDDGYNDGDDGFNVGFGPFSFLSRFFPMIIGLFFFSGIFKNRNSTTVAGKFKRKYKQEYYRDYPYEGDFIDVYHILYRMGVGNFENLLTAFILKWINEEKIMTETEEAGFLIKKDQTNIRFLNKTIENNTLEGQLFNMMLDAAGSNNILEEKEFTKWATRNRNQIEAWEKRVKDASSKKLQEQGYLKLEEKKVLFFNTKNIVLTPKGEELEMNIYKYINYLYDFSLLNEHEAINVKIWDNIMIWAGALGLTEVVSKQFEKLYPRYETETVYRGNSIYLAHALTRNVARAAAPPSSSTRSGGGGGFSSGGGGGGSFGGGSGGGTR